MKTNSGSNDSMRGNPPGATGKSVEENSVTFSLSALMAQTPKAGAKSAGAATKDDSGLIDLNALTAMEDSASKTAGTPAVGGVMPTASLGLFPFDAPPVATPVPTVVQQPVEIEEPPKKSSGKWIALGGVGVVAAAAVAFFLGMNAGGEHAQGAPTAEPTPTAAPTVVEAPKPPEPQVAAVDPGTAKTAAAKTAAKEPAKEAPKPAAPVKAATGTPTKAAVAKTDAPPAKEAPKPAAAGGDPCKGDLMCAMQRAAK
jgi:hypothetical protein